MTKGGFGRKKKDERKGQVNVVLLFYSSIYIRSATEEKSDTDIKSK